MLPRISRLVLSPYKGMGRWGPVAPTSSVDPGCWRLQHVRSLSVSSRLCEPAGLWQTITCSKPVLFTQECLVDFHDVSGLPWWATIVLSAAIVRTSVTFPLNVYQHYIIAKYSSLKPERDAIVEELKMWMPTAIRRNNWNQKQAKTEFNFLVRKRFADLTVEHNCHPLKSSVVFLFQLPIWISLSVALRNLVQGMPVLDDAAALIRLKMSVGGALWFPSLLAPDPLIALPLLMAACNICTMEVCSMSRKQSNSGVSKVIIYIFRGVCIVMIPIAAYMPTAVVLYWMTSALHGLVTNLVLMSPRVRRTFRIPLIPAETQYPYRQIWLTLRTRIQALRRANDTG